MRHVSIAALLSALALFVMYPGPGRSAQPAPAGSVLVSKQALPSVVGIAADPSGGRLRSRGGDDQDKEQTLQRFFEEFGQSFKAEREFFARRAKQPGQAGRIDPSRLQVFGSGFFVGDSNLVVTAAHVAGEFKRLYVVTQDQTILPATVAAFDNHTDLAVLRLESKKAFPGLPLGEAEGIEVGEPVLAMGNPFGLTFTVTSGIVSAKGRRLDEDGPGMIQTDAPLNPGNSGGPIVDMQGRVVGVSHAIRSAARQGEQGFSIGLGFAVPVEQVKEIMAKVR